MVLASDPAVGWLNPSSVVGAVVLGVLAFALSFIVALAIRRGTRRIRQHLTDVTALGFVSAFAQLLTYLFGFVLYAHLIPELRAFGTALLTGVSVISVVIGVAAQNTLGNLVAGFWLVLSGTIRVGDAIHLASSVGAFDATVRLISLGNTVLVDQQGHEVIMPNSVIMGSAITRIAPAQTRVDPHIRS
ncbi:mechanosensitive ion channel domain-containing protein [Ottowia pentelensis]|uniref:mechanosensitive ion channel domain-containing protein n=1 Tax=Ottowia pentelensis TaxID=511108 RepID=UPI001D3AFE35|nr:mechanosensitive ion channel family protein [Pseudomonadota bacterium]MBS0413020.1 mechanosensitive ion channel family protein [Pseudomonadota bacterium]